VTGGIDAGGLTTESDAHDVGVGAPEVGAPEVGAPEVDCWAADILGIPVGPGEPGDWVEGRVAHRVVAAHDRASAVRALAAPADGASFAAFAGDRATALRFTEVTVGVDETERCPEIGSMVAWALDDGTPIISWIEAEPDVGQPARVVCVGPDVDASERALDVLIALVEGSASTWRGRVMLLDPSIDGLLIPLAVGDMTSSHVDADDELRRNLVVPITRFAELGAVIGRRGVLVYGPPGSGKRRAVRRVLSQLEGCTVIVVAPRALLHANLVRLAYDLAFAASPALVVLEDVDVAIGDWNSSPAPEGLVELVSQLDGPAPRPGVFTLATTNYGDSFDFAFSRRTGRFDRLVEVGPPSDVVRTEVLAGVVERHHLDDAGLVQRLVSRTEGWSFSQLVELERLAVLGAAADDAPIDLLGTVDAVRMPVRARDAASRGPGRDGGNYL